MCQNRHILSFFSCSGQNSDTTSEFWPKLVYVATQTGKKNKKKKQPAENRLNFAVSKAIAFLFAATFAVSFTACTDDILNDNDQPVAAPDGAGHSQSTRQPSRWQDHGSSRSTQATAASTRGQDKTVHDWFVKDFNREPSVAPEDLEWQVEHMLNFDKYIYDCL